MKKINTLLLFSAFISILPGCEWCECIHTKKENTKNVEHKADKHKDKDSSSHKTKHHEDHTDHEDKKPEHSPKKEDTPKPKEQTVKHEPKKEDHTAKAKTPAKKTNENPMAAAMEAASKK